MDSQDEKSKLTAVDALGARLASLASEQVALREPIERRWLDDIRQYQGQTSTASIDKAQEAIDGLRDTQDLFINVTRHKTNAGEAVIGDMLFPGDQKNWGIDATPVPTLVDDSQSKEPVEVNGQQMMMPDKEKVVTKGDVATRAIEIAAEKAEKMELEIEDQFVECGYDEHARDAIHYSAMLGTGILKGPIVEGKVEKRWQGNGEQWDMESVTVMTPAVKNVNPFYIYPDMQAANKNEMDFIFEVAYPIKRQMQELVNDPDIIPEQLVKALKGGTESHITRTSYQDELRAISGLENIRDDNRYELWQYRGRVDTGTLVEMGIISAEMADTDEAELLSFHGVVWFCNTHVVKVKLSPQGFESFPYYFYPWEKDHSSVFGYGVPYMTRQAQRVINVAWRQMLDNSSNTAGPQIVVDKSIVEPENGDWEIAPFKIWNKKRSSTTSVKDAFAVFSFNNHQGEIANIYGLAQEIADNESGVPKLAQGQQGKIQTLGEATMQQDNVNNDTRRRVREWDDSITKPLLRAMYDWNMRYNEKQEIKGDFNVKAIGSSTLMEQSSKQQALVQVARDLLPNPYFSPFIKTSKLLSELIQSFKLDAEGIVRTDEEVQSIKEQQQTDEQEQGGGEQGNSQVDQARLEVEKAKVGLKQQELQFAVQKMAMEERIELIKLAQHKELTLEQLDAKLKEVRMREEVNLHKFNTEVKLKRAMGEGI